MGWLYSSAWPTKSSLIHHLTREQKVGGENSTRWMKTVAKCVRGGTLYAVMEVTGDSLPDQRFLAVVLMKKSEEGWGYKDMEESCGPTDVTCPPSYFDLVGPPPNEYAREWRERCRARAAKRTQKVNNGEYWYHANGKPAFFRIVGTKELLGVPMDYGSDWIKYKLQRSRLAFQFWRPEWATDTVKNLLANLACRLIGAPPPEWASEAKILADALQDVGVNEDVCRCLREGGNFTTRLVSVMADAAELPKQWYRPLMATFVPQRWDADYVRNDGEEVGFDATENFLSMSLREIRQFRLHDYSSDYLANGLPARDKHPGPFEVNVDLDDWLSDCGIESRKEITEEQLERLRRVFGVLVTNS